MIDHRTAQRLAAKRIDSSLDPAEQSDLLGHLAACGECRAVADGYRRDAVGLAALVPLAAPAGLQGTVLGLADRRTPATGVPWLRIAFVTLLLMGSLGAAAWIGSQLLEAEPIPLIELDRSLVWQTDVVTLEAGSLVIDAGGRRFTGQGATFSVHSDPGDREYWTLELEWFEQGVEQRLYLYFAADATSWWIDEIRTYDGVEIQRNTEWASFPKGPYARTTIGASWTGTLDVDGIGRTGPVHLRLGNVLLRIGPKEGFAAPPDGGRVLEPGSRPFAAHGPLHCSGILQMTPALAHATLIELGYRVSWREGTGAMGEWKASTLPPEGVIADYTPVVGMDGAIVIAVVPFGHPDASLVPFPADCAPR